MPEITTYIDALRAIWNRSGYDKGFISNPFAGDDAARLGLVRTQALLTHLAYDPLPYPIVHVAGSKGKGSISIMIDSVLRASGLRSGRYMSPQLHSFRERFIIDGVMIDEDGFIDLTRRFITSAEQIENERPEIGQITAFELSTAMALGWFAEERCDVAVVEVGLGGTLDATNIVTPTLSVITTLDYEHTAILGDTLAEIASNKAGIIKSGRPVLSARQPEEALRVIAETAKSLQAPLKVADTDWRVSGADVSFGYDDDQHHLENLHLELTGDHQVANAGLAIAAVYELLEREPALQVGDEAIRNGLAAATLPARFERAARADGTTVIIDGAHTPASARALAAALKDRHPAAEMTLIVGMLVDKDPAAVLTPLIPLSSHIVAVSPRSPRAMNANDLASVIDDLSGAAEVASSVEAALSATSSELVVVTGSFTTAAEARVALGLAEFVDPPLD